MRQHIWAKIALLAASGLLLGLLVWQDNQPLMGKYVMECQQQYSLPPYLELDARGQFGFMQDILSSYWPHGEYQVEGDRLTARCHENQYVFQIQDNKTLRFLAEESSKIHTFDTRISPQIQDGAVFRLQA